MSNVHYRLLDERRFSISGSSLVSDGIAEILAGYYIIVSPVVINSLGGTPSSTIAAATIESSALRQSNFDPQQPASDFALNSWTGQSWPNASTDLEGFKTAVGDWILNNLDNSIINPGSNPFNFYLLNTTISGTQYLVPIVYLGADGEILNAIPVAPRVTVIGTYTGDGLGVALDRSDRIWSWGWVYNGLLGFETTYSRSPFRLPPESGGNGTILLFDQNSYAWAWGSSSGSNRSSAPQSPVSVIGGRQWLFLNTGLTQAPSLGIDFSSYAWAWVFLNSNGQVGDGTTITRSSPVSVLGDRQWRFLAGGDQSGMGIDILGYAWAWGRNAQGLLGNNNTISQSSPVSVLGDKQWIYLSGGSGYCLGIDHLSYVWAWGANGSGQIGDGTTVDRSSPVSVLGGRQGFLVRSANSAGLLIDHNSYAWAWGANGSGILGDGTTVNKSSPISVLGGRQYSRFVGGVAALDLNSYAWAWGSNSSGQCGDGTTINRSSPVSVLGGLQYSQLNSYTSSAILAQSGDYLWGWGFGSNLSKQTTQNVSSPVSAGLSPGLPQSSPVLVSAITKKFKKLYYSNIFMGLDEYSYAWGWGGGGNASLGDGTTVGKSSPVSVIGDRQFFQLAEYGLGLNSYGLDHLSYAWAWGTGSNGRNGNNSITNQSSPVSVLGGRQWWKITYSGNNVFALDSNSYAWAWGSGTDGSLGNNNAVNLSSPVSVLGSRQCRDISFAVLVDNLGYAWAWGPNSVGLVGDGTTITRSSPVSVLGGRQFRSVSRNSTLSPYCYALDEYSYAWAWGYNVLGVLADGTTINRSSPVSVIGGYQFDSLVARDQNVVAIKGSQVFAWGQNFSYQLANEGDMTSSPVAIAIISDISK